MIHFISFLFQDGISVEFLDFSEYSDPPLLTSVTTHRALDHNRGENDMVSGMEKYIVAASEWF